MSKDSRLSTPGNVNIDELIRISGIAVANAQRESRRLGVPNVYSINGQVYYETPAGELSRSDPYQKTADSIQ